MPPRRTPLGSRRRFIRLWVTQSERKHNLASSLLYEAPDEVDMAYRVFIDSNGVEWQAWDVLPKAVERRIGNRRVCREPVTFGDRRRVERRKVDGRWTPLTSGLRDGWLCFDGGGTRRR